MDMQGMTEAIGEVGMHYFRCVCGRYCGHKIGIDDSPLHQVDGGPIEIVLETVHVNVVILPV
jgi:hypothetical protein